MVTRLGIVTHGALAALLAVFCQGALGQISLSWELGASSPARQTFEAGRFSQAAQILTDASLAGEQGELDLARSHIASGNYENGRSILDKLLPRLRSTPNRHWLGEALVLAADLDFNHSLAQRLADASEAVEIFQAIEGRTGRNSVKAQALRAMIASDINANQGLALDADVQKNEAEGTTLTPRDRLWIKLANGVSLFKAGKREQANSVLADVVPAFSSLMGLEHPDMLYATYIHALVLQRLGKYETVYSLLVELQTRQAAVLGPDHPYRVRTLVLLVPEAVRVRDWSLATATAQTVVDLTRNRYGAQSVRYLATQGNLASVYLDAGNFPMAADIQSKALQGLAVVANGQTAHVDALYNMAMIDRARDHIGASLEGFQKVNEFDLKRLPVGHQDSWPVLSNIATLHTQLGNKPRGLIPFLIH